MANNNEWTAQQAIVVGGRGDDPVIVDNFGGLKRQARVWTAVLSVIMLFAALLVGATGAQMAAADDSPSPSASESSSPSALVEDSQGYITDPQNLLGDNLTKVIDAANRTKQETGVTVRLLYLESFNTQRSRNNGPLNCWSRSTLQPTPSCLRWPPMMAISSSWSHRIPTNGFAAKAPWTSIRRPRANRCSISRPVRGRTGPNPPST